MADCCTTDDTSARACPARGLTGPTVGAGPVRTHRASAMDGAWRCLGAVGRTLRSIPAARPEPTLAEAATTSR